MRRQLLLVTVPGALVGFVVAYVRMIIAERRVKRAGGSPSRPRLWFWTFGTGVVCCLAGAFVAVLSGLANHSHDLVASAVTGTFFLAPGLLLGLGIGTGRRLGSRSVWGRRAKGLR